MKHFIQTDRLLHAREQGSAMLTAIIFTFVIFILMGSYLFLASSEYRMSSHSYLFGASFNIAEGGIDRALYALNKNDHSTWRSGTDGDGTQFWAKRFGPYDVGSNVDAYINVLILDPNSDTPEIFSEGEAIGQIAGSVKNQLRVALVSGFFPFKNGFNSKNGIVLKGQNVTFDSYDSRIGNYDTLTNRNSDITVSTISVVNDAVDIGNADVYGYVATGGGAPDVGPHGSITSYANPGNVDSSRITTDYYAEFPSVVTPSLTSPLTSIPSSGTITGGDYELSSWSMSGSNELIITGPTRVVVSGDVDLKGNSRIVIASGGSLEIYADADVSIAGNGILNSSQVPSDLLIFGTNPVEGNNTFSISGNGFLSASVYAPNAHVSLNGGGSSGRVFGAVAAYDAKLVGNSHFSYDESLSDFNLGGSGYVVEEWTQLSGQGLTSMRKNMEDYGF